MGDDVEMDDFQAALEIGEKILEAADRLEPVDRVTPGAQAHYKFSVEGVTFAVVLAVAGREQLAEG
jgi:hypothetical protein